MMPNPVFYDFKRGILRLSVLLTLILFTVTGVGVAYLATSLLATMPTPQYYIYYSTIDTSTREFKLEIILLNPEIRRVEGEVSYKLGCMNQTGIVNLSQDLSRGVITQEEFNEKRKESIMIVDEGVARSSSGKITIEKTLGKQVPENYTCRLYLNITTPFGSQTMPIEVFNGLEYVPLEIGNRTIYILTGSQPSSATYPLYSSTSDFITYPVFNSSVAGSASASIYYNRRSGEAYLLLSIHSVYDGEFEVYLGKPGLINTLIEYGKPGAMSLNSSLVDEYFNKINMKIKNGISIVEFDTSLFNNTLGRQSVYAVLLLSRDNGTMYSIIRAPSSSIQSGQSARMIYNQLLGIAGIGLFALFFPVVVLYLIYVYVAKPRSQGALEFVLARPITRLELFATRYTAGVLVVLVATGLFYIALSAAIYFLTGVSTSPTGTLLLFAGLASSLIAFYSLCYLLASLTSGTRYIVASVLAYVLFAMLWSLVALALTLITTGGFTTNFFEQYVRVQYISYYFNPLRIMDFTQYYFMVNEFGEYSLIPGIDQVISEVVYPWAVALSTIAWIIIPVVLAWLKFKKASLYA